MSFCDLDFTIASQGWPGKGFICWDDFHRDVPQLVGLTTMELRHKRSIELSVQRKG